LADELEERMTTGEGKWVTYTKVDSPSIVRLDTEPGPRTHGWTGLPATRDEIAAEKERRMKLQQQARQAAEFSERPDVKHARRIGSYIEHHLEKVISVMSHDDWERLRRKMDEAVS
jgi:hypothetical protein